MVQKHARVVPFMVHSFEPKVSCSLVCVPYASEGAGGCVNAIFDAAYYYSKGCTQAKTKKNHTNLLADPPFWSFTADGCQISFLLSRDRIGGVMVVV